MAGVGQKGLGLLPQGPGGRQVAQEKGVEQGGQDHEEEEEGEEEEGELFPGEAGKLLGQGLFPLEEEKEA